MVSLSHRLLISRALHALSAVLLNLSALMFSVPKPYYEIVPKVHSVHEVC